MIPDRIIRKLQVYRAGYCLLLLVFLSACSKNDSKVDDPFDPSQAKVLSNEPYGPASFQKADIYLPPNRINSTRTMVLIHGGFWTSGDKSELDTLIGAIRDADPALSIVNMNYRLSDGNSANYFPAQMTDIKLLLDYLQSKAQQWHAGTDFALTGISSGGQLALLYAYAFDTLKRVKAVASVLGPTNLADPYYTTNPVFQNLTLNVFGKTYQQDSALYINASPVYKVSANSPPTFLAYAGADVLIPRANPDTLNQKLAALSIPHEYILYPSETHNLSRDAILDIIDKLAAFIKTYI